ncbi:unnamed protein product [Danaus chrysippus]|uniref:(African queen) hypothetical protein n=1 Tax=Danaus chrysippus TaxID=151541 RepID=A0A8J2R816_9NEOP|nr:unnamed protein product [Danaus chrysippus]
MISIISGLSRYFECDEDSDGYSSDDDYSKYSVKEEIRTPEDIDDEVFLDTPENDNTSTDLLLDEGIQEETIEEISETDRDDDQQLKVEVAASTTAMFNLLLYHPFSCSIQ